MSDTTNGRDPTTGRFTAGNAGGPGNPRAKQAAAWREAIIAATDTGQLVRIWQALLDAAEAGDMAAARLVLERCWPATQRLDVAAELPVPTIIVESTGEVYDPGDGADD